MVEIVLVRRWVKRMIAAGALALLLASVAAVFVERSRLNSDFNPHEAGFVGSAACEGCHLDRHESWYATYHRTMTQEASAVSVQGEFDGQSLDYWGLRVRPVHENGNYYFDYYTLEDEHLSRMPIERTVGSHRYQQYLTRLPEDGTYVRLHYLWHNGDQRWVHMNAAFLSPDEQDFDAQVAIWNQNCIFCHNTGPQPGMTNYEELAQRASAGEPVNVATDSRFQSTVAELGISCETCHGPGSIHVERAEQTWTAIAMRLNGGRDASIINPLRLDAERNTQICGQCHGQRMPKTSELLHEWMHEGPTFRAGLNLNDHVDPLWRHTKAPVRGHEDMFELRFWADGTPRLSAYEYQGLVLSACYQKAELSCIDCHTMHSGDPAGQLPEQHRGNTPCLACHQDLRNEAALTEHTAHEADGPGSLCYNCHMPDAAYGVMGIHRSHRIQAPDPVRDAGAGRPNACLNCHLDQSPQWAALQLGLDPETVVRLDGVDPTWSEAVTMIAGDPVQKAVIAHRAGRSEYGQPEQRIWLVPFLLETMADQYPSSRRFAQRSLLAILEEQSPAQQWGVMIEAIRRFDFIADPAQRDEVLGAIHRHWQALDRQTWPAPPPSSGMNAMYEIPEELMVHLRELGSRQDKQISIGE